MVVKALGRRLKRWPILYRTSLVIYYAFQPVRFKEIIFGTRARENEWAGRHLRKGNDWGSSQHVDENDEWVLGYWESREHKHRPLLIEQIASFYPFSNALEIGCNCGPNLYLLAKKFPAVTLTGIDINPKAIEKGKELFTAEGINNVNLLAGKADELGQFPDKSFDIVFTDAVLIYIARDKIQKVISEMIRIARKGMVLLEQHSFTDKHDSMALGRRHLGLWQRDYVALLRQFVPEERISVTKVSSEEWPGNQWSETGAIIKVTLGPENIR